MSLVDIHEHTTQALNGPGELPKTPRKLALLKPQRGANRVGVSGWYVLAESREVRGKRVLGVERLGQRLVLWRDADGKVVVHPARCPHRGADLSLGRVVEGALECPYHGFRFGTDGGCRLVPCEGKDYKPSPKLGTTPYLSCEQDGFVWLWHDAVMPQRAAEVQLSEVGPPPRFESLQPSLARTSTRQMTWRVPYERVIEGMLDLHHVPFAHRRTLGSVGKRLDPFVAKLMDDGETVLAKGGLCHEDAPNKKRMSFELQLAFPGYMLGDLFGMRLLVAMTPIDEQRCWIVYRYYSDIPIIGGFLAWIAALGEDKVVQVEDQQLQESSAPEDYDRHLNHYVPSDAAFLLWHKLYRQRQRDDDSAAASLASSG